MLDEERRSRKLRKLQRVWSQLWARSIDSERRRWMRLVLFSATGRYRHLGLLSRLSNTEMKITPARARNILRPQFLYFAFFVGYVASAPAHLAGQTPFSAPAMQPSTTQSNTPAVNPGASINAQNPLFGSVPEGKATNEEMPLSIMDAISLGLRHNLGLFLNRVGTESSRAARIRALSDLLPNLTGSVRESVQQVNLAAFGVPLPPGTSPIAGPFGIFDARAALSQSLVDLHALNNTRSAGAELKASELTYRNARELVTLVVGAQYLQVIANMSR